MNAPAASPYPLLSLVWSQKLSATPRGLVLAREAHNVLAWGADHWLHLLNHAGARQGQSREVDPVVSACCADDGSAYAVVGGAREVAWLGPDLMPRWRKALPHAPLAAALDAFGRYLAVADEKGSVHLFDARGEVVGRASSARPLCHVAFVPAAPWLVGSADFGLAGSFDMKGTWRWRDGLIVNIGSLAVNGDGSQLLLDCFSEGLRRFDASGKPLDALRLPEPCRLVAQSFDGSRILVAAMDSQIWLIDPQGRILAGQRFAQPVSALALAALADFAIVALADGTIQCLKPPAARS